MLSADSIVVRVLLVTFLVHQLRASTFINIQQQTPETECYCKCPCNSFTTTSTTTTTLPPSLTICHPNLTGYYPHPDDICQKYVYCSRGLQRFSTLQCEPGLYFTPGNNMCTREVPPGCEYPDTNVVLHESTYQRGPSKSIQMKWGKCYNLEDIDMYNRITSISFFKNDCVYLCDTNQCDGNCSIIKANDSNGCMYNLANCDFDKRAKSIGSCLYHGDH